MTVTIQGRVKVKWSSMINSNRTMTMVTLQKFNNNNNNNNEKRRWKRKMRKVVNRGLRERRQISTVVVRGLVQMRRLQDGRINNAPPSYVRMVMYHQKDSNMRAIVSWRRDLSSYGPSSLC